MARDKAALVRHVFHRVLESLNKVDADAVLVTRNAEAFAAAQRYRLRADVRWQEALSHQLIEEAQKLGRAAQTSRLVLFIGSGVSQNAGLPDWNSLLDELEYPVDHSAGSTGTEPPPAESLDALDRAELIKRRYARKGIEDDLGRSIRAIIQRAKSPSLQHQLLASLPASEVVTTNYDDLFEVAWDGDEARSFAVLPSENVGRNSRWLLKLHGDAADPESELVLARSDYLNLERHSAALAGLVQASLMTRHVLFVGYSLSDYNLNRMIHDVLSVTKQRPRAGGELGTIVTPDEPGHRRELWKDDLHYVSTRAETDAQSVRLLEIFLDRVVAEATLPVAHLTDPTYEALLSDNELELARAILDVREAARREDGVVGFAALRALEPFIGDTP